MSLFNWEMLASATLKSKWREQMTRATLILGYNFQLFFSQFPARIQLIEILDRLEHQRVTALSFGSPEEDKNC